MKAKTVRTSRIFYTNAFMFIYFYSGMFDLYVYMLIFWNIYDFSHIHTTGKLKLPNGNMALVCQNIGCLRLSYFL